MQYEVFLESSIYLHVSKPWYKWDYSRTGAEFMASTKTGASGSAEVCSATSGNMSWSMGCSVSMVMDASTSWEVDDRSSFSLSGSATESSSSILSAGSVGL